MNIFIRKLLVLGSTTLLSLSASAFANDNVNKNEQSLFSQIEQLDTELFDAFSRCDDPAQFSRFSAMLSPDLEFYHDKDGVSNREVMLSNTKKNACGKYSRQLVKGSLRVFPIGEFGAMEIGVHQFCSIETGKCPGAG